ncbi:MAG: ABC transporter permease [Longimicrobiales bacterium]
MARPQVAGRGRCARPAAVRGGDGRRDIDAVAGPTRRSLKPRLVAEADETMQGVPRFVRLVLRVALSREAYVRATGDLVDLAKRVSDVRGAGAARRACVREAGFILLWSAVDAVRRAIARPMHGTAPLSASPALAEGGPRSFHLIRRRPMRDLGRDLRHGARALRRSPGFAAVALLTLALGIGATTALFSVVDRVLLHPTDWPEADRIAVIGWEWSPGGEPTWGLSPAKADYWKRSSRSFEGFAIADETHFVLTGEGEPQQLSGERVSAGYFEVIGIRPALGRAFSVDEDLPGAAPVVVLTDGLWRLTFGAEPDIVGRDILLDGVSHTVVGVMPPSFGGKGATDYHLEGGVDVLVPLRLVLRPHDHSSEVGHNYFAFGRLARGVSLDRLGSEVEAFRGRFASAFPNVDLDNGSFRFVPLADYQVGDGLRTTVWLAFGAVALVLLIACANVANLLLARSEARRQELAVRAALGASRGRIAGQLVAESLLLGLLGGALGLLLAKWGLDAILVLAPEDARGVERVGLRLPVLAFAVAVSAFTGLGVGLAGGVSVVRRDLAGTLREGGRAHTAGRGRLQARGLLVMAEAAISVVLLVGAGLLLTSLLRLRAVDVGFQPEGVYTVELRLPPERYATTESTWLFESQVIERLRALPGVAGAGSASNLPLVRGLNAWAEVLTPGERRGDVIEFRGVSPSFPEIVGMQVTDGRGFTDADRAGAPAVAMVNEAFVRRFFANQDPLGATISVDGPDRTVVGVVRDVKDFGPRRDARSTAYAPRSQLSDRATRGMNQTFAPAFVLHAGNPATLAAGIRRAVQEVDPSQPILRMRPLEDVVAVSMENDRFFLRLLGTFATLALVLTAVGIYGVVSYAVGQRTHEIGLRMALGARRGGVVGIVIGQGMVNVAFGLAAGLVAAYALSQLLAEFLFEVSETDPATFAGVTLLLAAVAGLACYVPARRASRVDPMIALRGE